MVERLYQWACELPEYETIITEDDRKRREFENVTALKIVSEFSRGLSEEETKSLEEYADFEIRLLDKPITNQVECPEYKDVPVEEKPALLREALKKYLEDHGIRE